MTDFAVGERVYPLYAKGDTRRAGTIGGFGMAAVAALSAALLLPGLHKLSR